MNEIRKVRIKEFCLKSSTLAESRKEEIQSKKANQLAVDASLIDDGRFLKKFIDTVNPKECKEYFCNYNDTMFAQVSTFS